MWSRLTTTVAAALAATALAVPTPAPAAVLLEDSFDQENGGVGVIGYNAFANWDVVTEEVDLIGNGFWDWRPGNGLYVDLVSYEAGAIASKQEFTLVPGDYVLRFDLSGSAYSLEDTVTVTLGNVYREDFTLPFDEDFSARTRTIRVDSPTTGRLMFDHHPPDDTGGLLVDDVLLTGPDSGPPPPPPEPPAPPPPPPPPPVEDADKDGVADTFDRSVVTEPPEPEESAVAQVERGTVLILVDGEFRPLQGRETVPIGATIDATAGAIKLTVAADTESGKTYSGTFAEGVFKLEQLREEGRRARRRERAGRPLALITELVLKGGTPACVAGARAVAAYGGKRRKVRRLWGDAEGRFRTRGRYGAATVRGTVWLTKDRCDGTLVRVVEGKVAVEDFGRDRTVVVRAGESYVARAP
jgi:hypothetical protein